MYALSCNTNTSPQDWNAHLTDLIGSPFHTHQWSRYSSENKGRPALYFKLTDSRGAIVAMAHGLAETRLSRKTPLFRSLGFGSLPAYKDGDALNEMIRQIQRYAAGNGYLSVQWNSFDSPDACRLCDCLPDNGKKRWEFVVELGETEDNLWKMLHSKKRNMINKARKTGLRIERALSGLQIKQYRDMALETWQRKTEQGIQFPAPPGEAQFDRMKKHLIDSGIGRMYLAYDGPEPVAGAFFTGFAHTAYYVLSAAAGAGLKKSAPDLLIWTAMSDYLGEGCRRFNLGGVSQDELHGAALENSGLYHFKVRFSAQVQPCFNAVTILKPALHRFSNMLTNVKKALRR